MIQSDPNTPPAQKRVVLVNWKITQRLVKEYGETVTVTPASTLKTPETLYVPVSVVFDVIMRSPVIGVVEHWAKVSIEIPEESNSKRRE